MKSKTIVLPPLRGSLFPVLESPVKERLKNLIVYFKFPWYLKKGYLILATKSMNLGVSQLLYKSNALKRSNQIYPGDRKTFRARGHIIPCSILSL